MNLSPLGISVSLQELSCSAIKGYALSIKVLVASRQFDLRVVAARVRAIRYRYTRYIPQVLIIRQIGLRRQPLLRHFGLVVCLRGDEAKSEQSGVSRPRRVQKLCHLRSWSPPCETRMASLPYFFWRFRGSGGLQRRIQQVVVASSCTFIERPEFRTIDSFQAEMYGGSATRALLSFRVRAIFHREFPQTSG